MGVVEDLIAVTVVTGAQITWESIFIITLIAIPFAVIGELIVDRMEFTKKKRK